MSISNPIERRGLLKVSAHLPLVTTLPVLRESPINSATVSVATLGARGDGVTDDTAAFKAALGSAKVIEIPPGIFRITSPLRLGDGQIFRGAGKSGWEPYSGSGPANSVAHTELMISGIGIDARNSTNAAIYGLAIRSVHGRQSDWGQAAGFQAGTVGIDISGSNHFDAVGVSFHGLETGLRSYLVGGVATQMPRLSDWVAEDCDAAIRFISEDPKIYGTRDARIEGCIAAIHCNSVIEAEKCDGLRIENVRFFQCLRNSIVVRNTPFLSITGATFFETGDDGVVLENCQYVTISGSQIARSGYFKKGKLEQKNALRLEGCSNLTFDGLIQQPVGRAVQCSDCSNISFSGSIGGPFWSTGYLGADDGAFRIERSRAVLVNASFSGSTYWMAVWADAQSANSVSGRVVTEGSAGVVRCISLLTHPWGHICRTSEDRILTAGETFSFDVARVLVPGNHVVSLCSAELTMEGFDMELAGKEQVMAPGEPGGGSIFIGRNVLMRNSSPEAQYVTLPIAVRNSSSQAKRLPAGFEARLSIAFDEG